MPVNQAWSELSGISSPKLNSMTVVAYTGTEISALSSTAVDGQIVYCYQDGSIYMRGHWYGWDEQLEGGMWVDLVMLPNTYEHFASDEYASFGAVLDRRSATKEMYYQIVSGTGANVGNVIGDNGSAYISMDTGTTSTGHATIYTGGPILDFSMPALLKVKFRTSSGAVTGQINKLGVNVDRAGTGPSTRRMFGIEWCDGDSSFQVHSANGTSQSNFDTGITVTTDAVWEADIYFSPGQEVKVLFDDGTTVTEKIKTTFIPTGGTASESDIMKFSISNNNGNTTSRELEIHAAYLVYGTGDQWWT